MHSAFFYAEGVVCLNKTIVSVGAITHAIKAQRLLTDAKIHSKLIKVDYGTYKDGCIYGLVISDTDYPDAALTLKKGGIAFSLSINK